MKRFAVVLVAAMAGTTWAKDAPAPAPKEAPKGPAVGPVKELDALKPLAGKWKCNGQETAVPGAAPVAYKSTLQWKLDLDSSWYAVDYNRPKDKFNPAFIGRGHMGWSAGSYLFAAFDNWGGHWTVRAQAAGDKIVFEGEMSVMGQKLPMRYTLELHSDKPGKPPNELDTTAETKQGGDWKALDVEVCKR